MLLVDLLLEEYDCAQREIVLDLDNTDSPMYGEYESCFVYGYYKGNCYLPLYVFCDRYLLRAR